MAIIATHSDLVRKLTGCALAALVAGLGTTAKAQTDDAQATQSNSDDAAGSEIVVTAQFRQQRLQDTPLAITAVNSEMLQARSQTDISQVANQAPSVTLKPQGATFGPSMGASIRGVGQFDFNPAVEQLRGGHRKLSA